MRPSRDIKSSRGSGKKELVLSKNCNFCSTNGCFEGLLRDRIVAGIKNDKIREKLLSEKALTLLKTIDICRLCEKASDGMAALSKSGEDNYFNRPRNKGAGIPLSGVISGKH